MSINRRDFLKTGAAALGAISGIVNASTRGPYLSEDRFGVLSDLTYCIGCRKCEWACNTKHDHSHDPITDYDDISVFENYRRPDPNTCTVVNRFDGPSNSEVPLDVKIQCMHCEHPACVSACIVGALHKTPEGPVTYDKSKCVGCRYCMVACPFQIPTFDYHNALTPVIEKCNLCVQRITKEGKPPACVEICPREAILFGTRDDLLELACDRIKKNPERYIDHIYGEKEVGGTSWLYLTSVPFEKLKLPVLPNESPAALTESIQHGIFKGFTGPIMLFGLLGLLMKLTGEGDDNE